MADVEKMEKPKEHRAFSVNGNLVRTLRFAHLDANGDVVVESADEDFDIDSDDSFDGIGVCSYAWGNERTTWKDNETELSWPISSRCLGMCKAALENFNKVWIDGLCMVQISKEHKDAVMAVMGKIYYRDQIVAVCSCVRTCVPEVIIGMTDIYFHRGWVQQEIAFTNIKIHSKILSNFFKKNEKMREHYEGYKVRREEKRKIEEAEEAERKRLGTIKKKKEEKDDLFSNYELCDTSKLFRDLKPTIRFLLRIICGRYTDDIQVKKLSEYYSLDVEIEQGEIKLDNLYVIDGNMYGDYEREEVSVKEGYYKEICGLFDLIPGAVWSSPREENKDHIRYAAIVSYSTGFFTFNADRLFACFALASYALYMEQNYQRLQDELDQVRYEQDKERWRTLVLKRKATVIANPGRYCTGYQPVFPLQTLPIIPLVDDFLKLISDNSVLNKSDSFDGHRPYTDRHNLDVMFSVIHATTDNRQPNYDKFLKKLETYDYVMGYRIESSDGVSEDINSTLGKKLPLVFQILGLKPKGSPEPLYISGLVSEYSKKARFTQYGGSHKNRFGQDSETQHLDALRVIVENSSEMYHLKKYGREREVKMIKAATEKAIKFLDYAFSYLYNFVIAETLTEEGRWPENAYSLATTSIHTSLPNKEIDEWRDSVRMTVEECQWGHESWEHFGFVENRE